MAADTINIPTAKKVSSTFVLKCENKISVHDTSQVGKASKKEEFLSRHPLIVPSQTVP